MRYITFVPALFFNKVVELRPSPVFQWTEVPLQHVLHIVPHQVGCSRTCSFYYRVQAQALADTPTSQIFACRTDYSCCVGRRAYVFPSQQAVPKFARTDRYAVNLKAGITNGHTGVSRPPDELTNVLRRCQQATEPAPGTAAVPHAGRCSNRGWITLVRKRTVCMRRLTTDARVRACRNGIGSQLRCASARLPLGGPKSVRCTMSLLSKLH
jgi:hypothetical protein